MEKSFQQKISENSGWVQWVGTLTVFISCFLFLLHRIEVLEAKQDVRIQEQSDRTDKLYEMFIDLLKDRGAP